MNHSILDAVSIFTAVVFVCVVLLLSIVIWSIRRHRDPKLHIECDSPIDELIPSLAGLTLSTAVAGNSVKVSKTELFSKCCCSEFDQLNSQCISKPFFGRKGCSVSAWRTRCRSGLVQASRCVSCLTQRPREVGKAARRQMEEAGRRVVLFHEKAFRNIGVLNDRDHRKLVVIDGREAFVGGHCIVDSWLGDAQDSEHFGDISLRLRGPIVNSVQSAFSENWAGETGELFVGDDVFPTLEPAGDVLIHAAYAKPEGSAPAVKILHHTAICLARKRIWIQNPYFIPEPKRSTRSERPFPAASMCA